MLTIKLPKAYLSAKGWVMDTCIHKIAKGRFVAYAIGHKIDNENKPLMYIKWLS
jgi:predicted Co/Zn/Cd cation transporter (cation efflux family)